MNVRCRSIFHLRPLPLSLLLLCLAVIVATPTFSWAQTPAAPQRPTGQATAAPGRVTGERPAPRVERLLTPDGVVLVATYYPSDRGKEAVPVLLVHELQGQASPYKALVESLWKAGCAVIVPELRGHGSSKHRMVGGRPEELDVSRMRRVDIQAMVNLDLETVKKFLVRENDAGLLNLNALVVIGVGEGAVLASHWAARDLNFPSVGALKQGQDVKSLVLIAPEKSVKGLVLDDALGDPLVVQLPIQIVVGGTSGQWTETDRSYKRLDMLKKRASAGLLPAVNFEVPATSLDGHRLVNDVPGVIDKIRDHIVTTVVDHASKIPWVSRQDTRQ